MTLLKETNQLDLKDDYATTKVFVIVLGMFASLEEIRNREMFLFEVGQYVMTHGAWQMPTLFVESWVTEKPKTLQPDLCKYDYLCVYDNRLESIYSIWILS